MCKELGVFEQALIDEYPFADAAMDLGEMTFNQIIEAQASKLIQIGLFEAMLKTALKSALSRKIEKEVREDFQQRKLKYQKGLERRKGKKLSAKELQEKLENFGPKPHEFWKTVNERVNREMPDKMMKIVDLLAAQVMEETK